MVFSTSSFLFFFFPAVLSVYYLLRKRAHRNWFLAFVSLAFYAWGEPWFVFVMLLSIVVNWYCALQVGADRPPRGRKIWLTLSVLFNVTLLCAFKYLNFATRNFVALGILDRSTSILLPIGISFFTFQALSYVIDVYRGDGKAQTSLMNVCLYISFFPQLIAGPIVRYQTVADQIENRVESLTDFSAGARRFIVGLAKKVVIANNLALMLEHAYRLPASDLSVGSAWLAAIFFLMQVFFDFSGYSDMAIGLGKMFGFHFLENFHYPHVSRSTTEFWRRWHMSLSTWFRDYVFFPMGGSRVKTKRRLVFNLFVVWALTGFWHGADWCFVVWGVSLFAMQALEKFTGLDKWMEKRWFGQIYAIGLVSLSAVFVGTAMHYDLNAVSSLTPITDALHRIGAALGFGRPVLWDDTASMYVREYGVFMLMAVACSLPLGQWIKRRLHIPDLIDEVVRFVVLLGVFVLTLSYVVMGGYNPFIYFNF